MSPAPDLSPGYPSKGELISVAWQAAWDELEDAMVDRAELQGVMAEKSGCSLKTASNLISKALRHHRVIRMEGQLCRRDVLAARWPDHPALVALSTVEG